jgi:hypothetical protein
MGTVRALKESLYATAAKEKVAWSVEKPLTRVIGKRIIKRVEELKSGVEGVMKENGWLATRMGLGKFTSRMVASIKEHSMGTKSTDKGVIAGKEVEYTRGNGNTIE